MKARKANKKRAQQIMATVVMGMSIVNTAAPLVALTTAEQEPLQAEPVGIEEEALDYMVLPQLLQELDQVIFAVAEAKYMMGTPVLLLWGWVINKILVQGRAAQLFSMTAAYSLFTAVAAARWMLWTMVHRTSAAVQARSAL